MKEAAEEMVRLMYRHYATLLGKDGVATEPAAMLDQMSKPLAWWGVMKSGKGGAPVYNRICSGMMLLADQEALTVILSPGHILPMTKRPHTPTGDPSPSVRRMVTLAPKNGRIMVKKVPIPEGEVRAYLAEMGIPVAPTFLEIVSSLVKGTYPIQTPYLVCQPGKSLQKSAEYFAPSTETTVCLGLDAQYQTRGSGEIRRSWAGYQKLVPEARAEVHKIIKTKIAQQARPEVVAWWRGLPGILDDRQVVMTLIKQEIAGNPAIADL